MTDGTSIQSAIFTITSDGSCVNVVIEATETHDVAEVQAFGKVVTKFSPRLNLRPWLFPLPRLHRRAGASNLAGFGAPMWPAHARG
jgi:hypothetical protein